MNPFHAHQYLINGVKNFSSKTPPTLVLAYHSIRENQFDPLRLSVSPKHFEEHLIYLKNFFQIKTLQDLPEENLRPSVVITFDDNYNDILINALPLLEKYNIPATLFVAPSFLEKKFYYWDVVTEYIRLDLDFNKLLNQIPSLKWKSDKTILTQEVCNFLKWMPLEQRDNLTNELIELMPLNSKLNESVSISRDQLLQLSQNPLVEIGAHSMNHNPMSSLSKEMQLIEIKSSLDTLENIIHKKIDSYAFPYGGVDDFNLQSKEIVKEMNLKTVTTIPGFYRKSSLSDAIPRIIIMNQSVKQLRWTLFKTNFYPLLQ